MMFKRTKRGIMVGGIEYSADITAIFLLLIAFQIFSPGTAKLISSTPLAELVTLLLSVGLVLSLLLHEAGHAYTAISLGIPMKGIKIFMLGGMAMMEKRSRSPHQEFLIAIAGPLVSLVLWLLMILPVKFGSDAVWAKLLYNLGFYNLVIAVFNMVPAFPTDGGRVLRSIIWAITKKPYFSTKLAVRISAVIASLYVILCAVGNGINFGLIMPIMLAVFIVVAGRMELNLLKKELLDGQTEREA